MPRTRTVKSSGLNRKFGSQSLENGFKSTIKVPSFILFGSFWVSNIDTSNFMQDRLFAKTNFAHFRHGAYLWQSAFQLLEISFLVIVKSFAFLLFVIAHYFCQCSQKFHFFQFFPPWSGLCDTALALLLLAPWLYHLWNQPALCLSQFVAKWKLLILHLIAV